MSWRSICALRRGGSLSHDTYAATCAVKGLIHSYKYKYVGTRQALQLASLAQAVAVGNVRTRIQVITCSVTSR